MAERVGVAAHGFEKSGLVFDGEGLIAVARVKEEVAAGRRRGGAPPKL